MPNLDTITAELLASIDNPLDNVTPSMDFGASANTLWATLLGALWGGLLIWRAVCGIKALAAYRSTKDNPMGRAEAKSELMNEVWMFGAGVALPVIIGAIIFVFG